MPISKRKKSTGGFVFQATERSTGFPSLSKTFASRKEAKQWLLIIEGERRRGINFDPRQNSAMTFAEALQKYVEVATPKKGGFKQEIAMAKRILCRPFCERAIGQIWPYDLDGYVEERRAEGASGSTILKELSLISQVYTFVRRKLRMYAVVNPIPDVDKPTADPPRGRRLTGHEDAALLAFFEGYGNRYIASAFIFSIESGLRKSELLRLQWANVDLTNRWATVVQARKGRNPSTQPKIRGFPLTERAVAVLTGLKLANGRDVEGAVFKTTVDAIDAARKDALEATKIEDWHWHDCRHETASRLAVKGVGQELIKQMLGHKNLKMTGDYQKFMQIELVSAIK